MSRLTSAWCATLLAILSLVRVVGADEPKPAATPLTDEERHAFMAELRPLQERLAEMRGAPDMNPDRWADAQVFVKAVTWALELGPINDAHGRQMVKVGLRRAKERIEALAAGKYPWLEKPDRSARGYVSSVDDSVQPYCLILPANYDKTKPIQLHVVLHGSTPGTGTGELLYVLSSDGNGNDAVRTGGPANDFIELLPMGRLGENSYRFEGETDVDEAIEAVCRDYFVDRSKIVLRGSSLGGVGTWQLGLKRPDRYASIGPSAGPVDTIEFSNSPWKHFVRLEPLTPWQRTTLHLVDAIDYAANAGMVPVVASMGDQDPYYGTHLQMEQAFAKEGMPFVGLVDRGAGHGITQEVYQKQIRMLADIAAKGRDPFPKRIRFVTWTLRTSRCGWIEVLGLEHHYQRAEIDAKIGEDGSIVIKEPRNITRFAIHPPAVSGSPVSLAVGATEIKLPSSPMKTGAPLVIERQQGTWKYGGVLGEVRLAGKRPHLQGPMDDAFSRKFLCVRGTGQAWNTAVGAWADAQLKRFAEEWRRHYHGYLPVKNDTEVTESDIRESNLILFGDPGSNSWIAKVLPQLPIGWSRDTLTLGKQSHSARDHAVQLICPNPLPGAANRYVVLNSGHTYHDSELRFSYMVFPRLGDWAVMRVGNNAADSAASQVDEAVLDSAFFDEDWKVPGSP